MTNVSNQTELAAAITARENEIVIIADFIITERQTINYTVTISSGADEPHTLTKADNFDDSIFLLSTGADLTIQNIILDGARQDHSAAGNPQSLITVSYGSLTLGTGAVLQNNLANYGGAVYVGNSAAVAATLRMEDNAIIKDNYAAVSGGGIYYKNYFGTFEIGGQSLLNNNESPLGGGVYYESNYALTSLVLTVSGEVQITGNKAATGGGIAVIKGALRITDNAAISNNTAEKGGGIAFYGNNFFIDDDVQMLNNVASNTGGGFFLSSEDNVEVSLHGLFQGNNGLFTGGGYIENIVQGNLDFSRARFIENRSTSGNGGGLGIIKNTGANTTLPIVMNNATFKGNYSINYGGGLYIDFSVASVFNLSADDCNFENNQSYDGGGIYISASENSSVLIQNSVFSKNIASTGAGCFLNHNDSEQLSAVFQNVEFNENSAGLGAGLFLRNGNLAVRLNNVVMTKNIASQSGGGINNESGKGAVVIENNSKFISNEAPYGGGINNFGSRTINLTDVSFSQNSATSEGNDIFNAGRLEIGPDVRLTSGLAIREQAFVPIINQNLSSDSLIILEQNYYLKSNPQGLPIIVATKEGALLPQDTAAFIPPAQMVGWEARPNDTLDILVLAPITYTLNYENLKGAESPNPTSYTVVTSTITLINLPDTADFRFLGWYDAAEGGNKISEIIQGSTGNRVLYAQWYQLNHTVTYYGNDAGGPSAENVPLPQAARDGESVTLSDKSPTRTGYLFINWNTVPDGTGIPYEPEDIILNVTDDINLYAQWQVLPPTEHVLAYHPNDEGGPSAHGMPQNSIVIDGDTAHISSLVPSRQGYAFTGWNTSSDGSGTTYNPSDTIPNVTNDVNLYAQWTQLPPQPSYTLTYRGNDAGGPPAQEIPAPVTILQGESVILSTAIPTREGYSFIGWNTEPSGLGTSYQAGELFGPVNTDSQLFAQWIILPPKCFYVHFKPNVCCEYEVCNMPLPMKICENQPAFIPYCCPCHTRCCFIGWNTRADGCGIWYALGQPISADGKDVYLFAQWN